AHKYQSSFDDSFTIKIYLFQFVNFYSSLFYVAFFKGRFFEYPSRYGSGLGDFTEQCDPAGCLIELCIQLIIFMIGKQLINNAIEFFSAIFRTCTKTQTNLKQWEIDYYLNDFDSMTLFDEYLEMIIQFGFVTLFVCAFPLAPLFALINNVIEVRLDAWKFLSKYKRPVAFKAADIGIWITIMSGISYLAVLTNAFVIAYTSEFIPKTVYRSTQMDSTSLVGYVRWTLSAFNISDYSNSTKPEANTNVTVCYYRDWRQTEYPHEHTLTYWEVTAVRLAFIVVFEHVVYFTVYLMQWIIPDVPKKIQEKIDYENYIAQQVRWTSSTIKTQLKNAVKATAVVSDMNRIMTADSNLTESQKDDKNDNTRTPHSTDEISMMRYKN
ncbi:unnamed protein product, partial [Didymodactylos carnosus]